MAASSFSLSFIFFFFIPFFISNAIVPPNETFHYVNEGGLVLDANSDVPNIAEYESTYRGLPLFNTPFGLSFYNITPNEYTLALRMGGRLDRSVPRWVWEANRGKPVGENATFSLGSDGNLVLAEADGRIVWQTNTANKGVVGFSILSDGNMVLRDSKGNFVWQSFDYPTDTLLTGQTLRVRGGPYKLVSRQSVTNSGEGDYSFVIEPKRLAMYYKNNMRYWSSTFPELNRPNVTIVNATIAFRIAEYEDSNFYELEATLENARQFFDTPSIFLGTNLYNSTLSYLRLGIDGNVRFYTYRRGARGSAWFLLYTLFDRLMSQNGRIYEDECQLPNRCGKFGLCRDSQCVGCPTPKGVFEWSQDCDTKSPGCKASGFTYYELKGVDHFTVKYTPGDGPMKRSECESRCTKDCKCMGYSYHTNRSRCWIVYELKTLTRVGNSTSSTYIKTPIS